MLAYRLAITHCVYKMPIMSPEIIFGRCQRKIGTFIADFKLETLERILIMKIFFSGMH